MSHRRLFSLLGAAVVAFSCPGVSPQAAKDMVPVTIVVVDKTGAVVPGTQIRVSPAPKTDLKKLETGQDGALSLPLFAGEFALFASHPGFKSWGRHIAVRGLRSRPSR